MPISSGTRFFNEPEISDWDPQLRTYAQDFHVLNKPLTSAGYEHRHHIIIFTYNNNLHAVMLMRPAPPSTATELGFT